MPQLKFHQSVAALVGRLYLIFVRLMIELWSLPENGSQSGRGQPHSRTLSRRIACYSFREVLECGCPLPLSFGLLTRAAPSIGLTRSSEFRFFLRRLPQIV